MIDPLLSAMSPDYILPTSQSIGNAAIIAVFAYLVPLLTMEINFFRLAVYKSWRRMTNNNDMQKHKHENANDNIDEHDKNNNTRIAVEEDDIGSDTSSAVGHLMADVTSAIHETTSNVRHSFSPSNAAQTNTIQDHSLTIIPHDSSTLQLQEAYTAIRKSSMEAIISSLLLYTVTAIGISLGTRGLDPKVIAVVIGASQFMTALMVFIVSAKVPQWIGVYHEGKIRLVKCSSPYSQQFEHINLSSSQEEDESKNNYTKKLKWNVRLGVWFHFSKFYIILMPFYCGVQKITIPLSMIVGSVFGFILMWAVFVVHEKYIQHRNIVSFTTILLLSIISALCFTRGMAWMQMVWQLDILNDPDVLMTISFFTWLAILAIVHALFIWHTLKTEESQTNNRRRGPEETEEESLFLNEDDGNPSTHEDPSNHSKKKAIRRNSSYNSFVFDPRTHFKDTDHPDLDLSDRTPSPAVVDTPVDKEDNGDEHQAGEGQQDDIPPHEVSTDSLKDEGDNNDSQDEYLEGYCIETPMPAATDNNIANSIGLLLDDDDEFDNNESILEIDTEEDEDNPPQKKRRPLCCRPACCEVFVCFSPEYQQSSCLWKAIIWFKFIIIILTYLLCLYFVTVSIGATAQIKSTRENLPAVQEALYNHMNEGEVCAFDNQGPTSNITTFPSKEAAHDAGFLVLHCGACGACSTWENLIIEYTTRDTMAANANQCAKEALFGGGDDALTECLMEPNIGFGYECALCWMEDILCTKEHCSFIFLQSQMINEVTNFAVGPDDITSATCEEAHCEKGPDQFVPCSGATRRRMNITSSISRPGDQQCAIVDVESWEDLFFGSGVA